MFFYKRIYTLILTFIIALNATSQSNNKAIPLKVILSLIEKQNNVNFNYTENVLNTIKTTAPAKQLSLKDKLLYLENITDLSFENIDDKYINIFNKKSKKNIEICGYVLSEKDNCPIENANIHFEQAKTATTNQMGYFSFKKENETSFTISHIGFASKKITIAEILKTNCFTILLSPSVTELQEIRSNYFLASGISKSDGVFEIKPKKFGILPGLIEPDVLHAMQQIPGINSTDESVSSINVRGGTHDQNLFLWNGIRMYQTGHFFGLISAFNPYLAHIISIYKNGSSAFYGESVSSVVSISSNPQQTDNANFSAGINMINADVYSKFKITKKAFIEISGRKSITDFVETTTYKEYYNKAFQNTSITDFYNNQNINYSSNKKFGFYDITLKYFQKIGTKNQLILDLITISDKLRVLQKASNNNYASSEENTIYQKNYGGNLSWKIKWGTKNTTKINTYFSYYELDGAKNNAQDDQLLKQENKVLDLGFKLENNHIINSKLKFNNGYQFNEIGITNLETINNPKFYRKTKEVLRTSAVILEGIYTDTISRIYCNAGIRFNYIYNFKKYNIEPRLQFNYGLSTHLNLEILAEFKSQNSQQTIDYQKDYFGIEKRHWILSNNSTIPIQKSKQLSISLSYSKHQWLFIFENFYKKVTGITSQSQGFQNQLEFLKINGDYTVIGTEILIQKKINHYSSWLSYTYNDNNYDFPTFNPTKFSNNFEMNHVISWAAMYDKKNLKIALGTRWSSGPPETTPVNNIINPANPLLNFNKPNNKLLSSFFQINLSSTYKWESTNGIQYKLGLSLLNILNKKNEINEYYKISALTNTVEDVKTFSLRRTPNLSVRIQF